MPATSVNVEKRVGTLNYVLTEQTEQHAVEAELRAASGTWVAALDRLKQVRTAASVQKISFAHSLADWSDDNVSIVKKPAEKPNVTSLRDVALHYDTDKLAALVDRNEIPADVVGPTTRDKTKNFALTLQRKLFQAEPTAVLQRMLQDAQVPIADTNLRLGVATFFANQPEFNIRTTSMYTVLKHPEVFRDISEDQHSRIVENLKVLQRVQAISPAAEAVPALMKANLTSAFQVAGKPESTFLKAFSPTLGEETARQIYTNAINLHIRN